jgi:hypothetical protein
VSRLQIGNAHKNTKVVCLQQLGDSLGKGAFGQVYRECLIHRMCQSCCRALTAGKIVGALNWATGETVAVKEIQLSNIPKGELGEIMVSFGFHFLESGGMDDSFYAVRD